MMLSPELLQLAAAARLRTTRPDLIDDLDLSEPGALRTAKSTIAAERAEGRTDVDVDANLDVAVVAVINRFSLPGWARETCRFVLSMPTARAESWRRCFTRTLYLAGRPEHLRERFAFDHVADDGSVAWLGTAPDQDTTTLRRRLKTFADTTPFPASAPITIEVPTPVMPHARITVPVSRKPVHRDLYIGMDRVSVREAVIHMNHLLAEAVLDGLILPGDRLTLRSVTRLSGLEVPFASLRVDADAEDGLRAYAGLTAEL